MKRSSLTRSAALAAASALTLGSVLPAVAHTPVWDKGAEHANGEKYVALGDSFTSGPGIAPLRAGTCDRSEKNFPSLIAAELDVATFVDASCSGATTAHLTDSQTREGGTNDPQLDAVTSDTTLVTFGTIGGNDIGLVGLATNCAFNDCVPADGTDPLAAGFAALETRLTAGVSKVKELAPKADVVVVGYSTYVTPEACVVDGKDVITGVTPDEIEYLQAQIDRLSTLLRTVAEEQSVAFADQRAIPGALDHTACAAPKDQWIRGLDAHGDGALLHPSTAGMAATASFVTSVIEELRTPTTPVTPPVTKPVPTPTGPTFAERRSALAKKASAVRAALTCTGPKRSRNVTVKVTSRRGAVTRKGGVSKVVLKAGARTLKTDRKAPFTLTVKASKVKKHLKKKSTKVRAVVTVKHDGLTATRTITLKRAACLR